MRLVEGGPFALRPSKPRMVRPLHNLLLEAAVAALLVAGLAGCDGPCQTLAERICSCEPNSTEEQSCLLKVQIRGDTPLTTEEEMRCSELLDACSCEALADEDYLACGIYSTPAEQ